MNSMGRRLICAAILLAATFSLFVFVERYQGDNSQYLRNSDFKGGLTDWQIRGDRASVVLIDGVLRMQAATKGASPSVRQTIKRRPGEDIFRLSAWVRHDEVSGGLRAWHAMRILLASIDHSGRKLWDVPHVLEQRRGSGPWRRVVRVFYLPPQAVAVEVFAGLNMATGRMQIRDLNLEVVHERPAFRGGRLVLSAIWLFAAPWIIWPCGGNGAWPWSSSAVVFCLAV